MGCFKTVEEVKGAREEIRERREAIISVMDTSMGVAMNDGDCILATAMAATRCNVSIPIVPRVSVRGRLSVVCYSGAARQRGLVLHQGPILLCATPHVRRLEYRD